MSRIPLARLSLLGVAASGLFGAIAACDRDADDGGRSDDALYAYVEPEPCDLGDVTFRPERKQTQRLHQNVCSPAQVAELVRCRVTPLSEQGQWNETQRTSCKRFERAVENAACKQCAFTDFREGTWGALVQYPARAAELNQEGCIAQLSGDLTENGCGAQLLAAKQCRERLGDSCVCAPWSDATSCKQSLTRPGAAAAACDPAGDRYERAKDYLTLFCGP